MKFKERGGLVLYTQHNPGIKSQPRNKDYHIIY